MPVGFWSSWFGSASTTSADPGGKRGKAKRRAANKRARRARKASR